MARIISVIQFTGRAGSVVGTKGKNGKVLLRQYQPQIANPRTASQMSARARLKMASQVAGMLGKVGQVSLIANGYKKTDRGQLVRMLFEKIIVTPNNQNAKLNYDLDLVKNSQYTTPLTVVITKVENSFTATFSDVPANATLAKAILIHDIDNNSWRSSSALSNTNVITLAGGKSASENLEIFAYGILIVPNFDEINAAPGNTGADENGYILDLTSVTSTNSIFSPLASVRYEAPTIEP